MNTINSKISTALLFLIIIYCLIGCKKAEDGLSLNATETTLQKDQTFNLIVSPNASDCVFESENDNIAEVSSSGVITANLVGETNITVSNAAKGFTAKLKVTVTPEYNMYREPYLVFGKPKSDIKAYETRAMFQEDDVSISYLGENSNILFFLYSFETSAYSSSGCLIPSTQANLLGKYLAERYVYLGTTDDIIAMLTTDGKTYVATQLFSLTEIMVGYFPKTTSKNNMDSKTNLDLVETINIIKNRIKACHPTK